MLQVFTSETHVESEWTVTLVCDAFKGPIPLGFIYLDSRGQHRAILMEGMSMGPFPSEDVALLRMLSSWLSVMF